MKGSTMTHSQPRYSAEEFALRGEEIYARDIRSKVEAGNRGKVVAIDIETGAYELGEVTVVASDRLLARHPDAQIWFVRVGYPALHHLRMSMLQGFELRIQVVDGGSVSVQPLP
jgi:hypothetical protein